MEAHPNTLKFPIGSNVRYEDPYGVGYKELIDPVGVVVSHWGSMVEVRFPYEDEAIGCYAYELTLESDNA